MLGVAIAVAAVGFILKVFAAAGTGWFLVPLAAVACICHVAVHARAARAASPPARLAMLSNVFLIGALLMQMEFTPGYNCAEDTLSSVGWRLGLSGEEGCILFAHWLVIVIDLLLYVPAAATWSRLWAVPAGAITAGRR